MGFEIPIPMFPPDGAAGQDLRVEADELTADAEIYRVAPL
jgi:hypothetical protein